VTITEEEQRMAFWKVPKSFRNEYWNKREWTQRSLVIVRRIEIGWECGLSFDTTSVNTGRHKESLRDRIPSSRNLSCTLGRLSNLGLRFPHFLHAPTQKSKDLEKSTNSCDP